MRDGLERMLGEVDGRGLSTEAENALRSTTGRDRGASAWVEAL